MSTPYPRKSIIWSTRYHVFISASLILIQVIIILNVPFINQISTSIVLQTALLCFIATLLSSILNKNLSRYPGVENSSYLFAGLAASYGLLVFILLMLRIPYSRPLIASSFVINALAFSIIYATLRRETKLCIGLVPEGTFQGITTISKVEWANPRKPQ